MARQGVPRKCDGAVRLEPQLTRAGPLEQFPPRSITVIPLGRLDVGIVRWDGEQVYALRNVCPHAGGPVCEGRLGPRLTAKGGDPMQLEVDDSQPTVTCAWHGWEFDVRDGRAIAPGNELRVRSYPVCVRDGVVLVQLGATAER